MPRGGTRALRALTVSALLALTAMAAPATADTAGTTTQRATAETAYFEMTDITREKFVVQLTDPAKIKHARDLISGATTDKPHLLGRISPRQAPFNPRWSYHYKPDTVDFFDVAIEVCDATIPYVEDHLDEAGGAFLPGYVWCPWSSRLIREIPAP